MTAMILRPYFRASQFWIIIAAASIVLGVLSSLTTYLNARVTGRPNSREAMFGAGLWLVFGALTWIPYTLAYLFPLRRETIVRSVSAHIVGAAAMSLSWTLVGIVLARLITTRPPVPFIRYFTVSFLNNLSLCVFLYFAVLGCIHAFSYYREARERQERETRLAAQLAEARFSALRMQLNPHFLFNSLNAITVLVRDQKTSQASRMLELLSGVLRHVLQSEKRPEITLAEEIQFIEKYLAIEEVRFSDRLKIIWRIEDAIRNVLVPEFILQPLVENAIRHGISKRTDNGKIEIAADRSGDDVLLKVKDNGPGYLTAQKSGVGLANTHARLQTLFGDRAKLDIASFEGEGTIAIVTLPLRRQGDG